MYSVGVSICRYSLGTRPSKNRKGGSGKSAGVEVYTAPGMQAHFRLAFDWHSDVHLLEMLTAWSSLRILLCFRKL